MRLRHSSWTYEGAAIEAQGILDENDLQFLWLPMAHSFGKVLLSTQLACGFATAVDGRVDKIVDNLAVVTPDVHGRRPAHLREGARPDRHDAGRGRPEGRLFNRAFSGRPPGRRRADGRGRSVPAGRQHAVADKLVFTKVRARFGGRVRFFISGAAALNREIAEWFHAAGILILEGYGLTETCAGSLRQPSPTPTRFGSVGLAFPGTEVRIAEDGEILIKGPGVMAGYHNLPEQTAETLTEDGWLHTGDIGEIDDTGFLRITDRKKDLFKTSGGKYIAPSAIESMFKGVCPYASQLIVHGDGRNFVSALVTLDPDAMAGWAAENDMVDRSYAEIVTSPAAREMVRATSTSSTPS